jgi:hypothetical protein
MAYGNFYFKRQSVESFKLRYSVGYHSGMQEENKISDKMHRQKVAEVEKLSQTVRALEEAVLSGGAAANVARDYQRKNQELIVTHFPSTVFISAIHYPFFNHNI